MHTDDSRTVDTKPVKSPVLRDEIQLSPDQQETITLALNGSSVFFTGSAGTGKSHVLQLILSQLHEQHSNSHGTIAVTASTGTAACNIGGTTLHSFAGIGLGTDPWDTMAKRVESNSTVLARWRNVKVLIIDENGELFDKLSKIACRVRRSHNAFGGIQVIATGDFLQLPPVNKNGPIKFAFEAEAWSEVFHTNVVFKTVFRQRDQDFATKLNELRVGVVTTDTLEYFKQLARPLVFPRGPTPTELFPRRHDVELCNMRHLQKLTTTIHEFPSLDGGCVTETDRRDRILTNVAASKVLVLRTGAQVMLITNMDRELVNGSVGVVAGFICRESESKENNHVFVGDADADPATIYPVVTFYLSRGGTRDVILHPHLFTVQLPSGRVQASRLQFPLILAWAMSIHRAQGKTLSRLSVNFHRAFEKGQVYVALSRAVTKDGLRVLNFAADKVRAHPKVIGWYCSMEDVRVA